MPHGEDLALGNSGFWQTRESGPLPGLAMSAFGGKAEVGWRGPGGPLIAMNGHSKQPPRDQDERWVRLGPFTATALSALGRIAHIPSGVLRPARGAPLSQIGEVTLSASRRHA